MSRRGAAVLVHDPVGLGATWRAALVVDERLLEPDEALGVAGAAHGARARSDPVAFQKPRSVVRLGRPPAAPA